MSSQSFLASHPVLDLKQMQQTFRSAGIDTQRRDNQLILELILENDTRTTVLTVIPAYGESLDSGPVAAMLQIRTDISQYLFKLPDPDRKMDRMNRTAVMGAVYRDQAGCAVGSRITVRAGEGIEPSLLPLVFSAACLFCRCRCGCGDGRGGSTGGQRPAAGRLRPGSMDDEGSGRGRILSLPPFRLHHR